LFTNCTKVPSDQDQDNPFDFTRLPVSSQGTRIVRVYVKDNDGVRSKTDSVLVLGKDKTPLLTAPINKTQLANNNTTLTWVAGFYSSHYKVLLDTVTPPVNVAVATTAGTSFTPAKGLVFSKSYYWQVIGYNSSGEEAASQIWSFKTGDQPAKLACPPRELVYRCRSFACLTIL
jgi:hypothetical protein